MALNRADKKISGIDWIRSSGAIETHYDNSSKKGLVIFFVVLFTVLFFFNPIYRFTNLSQIEQIAFGGIYVFFMLVLLVYAFSKFSIFADQQQLIFRRRVFGKEFDKKYQWSSIKKIQISDVMQSSSRIVTHSLKITTDRSIDTVLSGLEQGFIADIVSDLKNFRASFDSDTKEIRSPSRSYSQPSSQLSSLVIPPGSKRWKGGGWLLASLLIGYFMFALVVGEYRWDKTFILSLVLTIVLSFGVFMLGLYFCLVETCVYWDNKHLRFVTMFLNHKGYQDFRWDSIYAMTVLEEHDRYGTSYHLSISQDGKTRTVLKYLSEKDAYALTEHLTSIQDKVLSSK